GLVRQHLDSYNLFIKNGLQQVVDEEKTIHPDDPSGMYVELGEITLGEPEIKEADGSTSSVWPMDARTRNLTYAAPITLKMTPRYPEEEQAPFGVNKKIGGTSTTNVYIGHMPIMLRSNRCRLAMNSPDKFTLQAHGEDPQDPGGYFIVNGTERVLVTQEDLAPNRILVEKLSNKSSTALAKVFSTLKGFRAPVTLERTRDGTLRVSFPSVSRKISLIVLLRALGLEKDGAIARKIGNDPRIQSKLLPILQGETVRTQEQALDFIGKRVAVGQTKEYRVNRTEQVLDRYLLPHLGNEASNRLNKANFLCLMAQKVLELEIGFRDEDDKDHYANKRLNLAGDLLLLLFRNAFRSLTRDIKYQLERNANKKGAFLKTAVRADVITERLRHALATGNWVGGKAGVSQLLDRTNYMSALSHLRRVVSPLSRSQPHFEARDLHPTHWGKICPNETPEGPNCGLVKNLALQAYISTFIDSDYVLQELLDIGLEQTDRPDPDLSKVFLNGALVGYCDDGEGLTRKIRHQRRNRIFAPEVNVAYYSDTMEVQINADQGRVRRPLIIVKDGIPSLSKDQIDDVHNGLKRWSDLTRQGIIEYLDAEEEENSYIAIDIDSLTREHTHLEISPATILGICASLIPFPEHNRSDRNVYEAGMAKQSLGLYAANFRLRLDTRAHILHYPQAPLVRTHGMTAIGFDERPAGQNFVVGVLSYGAYNMEDALIMNKSSIDRGLGRSTFFRSYEAEERRYPGGQEDKFEVPSDDVRGFKAPEVYRHLSEDGVVEPETEVDGKKGEVIIGRTSPPRFLESQQEFDIPPMERRRETSVSMRFGESGIVDGVVFTETQEGHRLIKVKMRSLRIPELGDKFASRHGQKGIIGVLIKQEDLPFTETGLSPDLIINPHAIPSRMTIGQLMELLAGKLACASGKKIGATAFEGVSADQIKDGLHELGFQKYGREVMYDGRSGEKLVSDVFVGVAFYQKLHHLVNDKIHARARGPVQILTRQPTEGRSREGGLKFGEMERDCLIGHGTALILKERLLDESDKSEALFCEECGFIAQYNRKLEKMQCPVCHKDTQVSKIIISYAFKLLLQELMSLGIAPRIELETKM
ncbi:MAG: DNA-directed RNA polymerase subunit B, partial [Candidatus Heimdallarchaeota archaeon]|nr:DNA-directed RNA polymerase subunit B [Candidatus Heimdallarchaeota archaeon]